MRVERRPHLAEDRRLWPEYEAMINEMIGG
jgi:hypothetical protein